MSHGLPKLRSVVTDATDPGELAEFYRELLGYEYLRGGELPDDAVGLTRSAGHSDYAA